MATRRPPWLLPIACIGGGAAVWLWRTPIAQWESGWAGWLAGAIAVAWVARRVAAPTPAQGVPLRLAASSAPPFATLDALERLRDTQRVGAIGDWVLDPATGMVELSPQACALYDIDPLSPKVLAESLIALYQPDQRELIAARLAAVVDTGVPERYELRRVRSDGRAHDELVVALRDRSAEGGLRIRGIVQDITPQREAERALAEAQGQLALAVEAADIGLWEWSPGSAVVKFSAVWKRQLGYAEDEVGDGFDEWRTRVHPDDLPPALERLEAFLAAPRGSYRSEFRMRHRDGDFRWFLATASLPDTVDGRPKTMLGAHVDITALKRASEAVAASEAQLRGVVDGLGAHMYAALLTREGDVEWVNSAVTATLGIEATSVVGRHLVEAPFWGEPARAAGLEGHLQRAKSGGTSRCDVQMSLPDGSRRWVDASLRGIADRDGSVTRLVASGVDIDERKRAEEAVGESEARLRRVLDGLGPRMFAGLCSPDGTLTWVNRASLDIAGLPEAAVIGHHFADTYWWGHDPATAAQLRDAMEGAAGGELRQFDACVRIGDGATLWVDFCVQPVCDLASRVGGLVVSAFDISERRAAQARLLHREQLLRTVFDNVHDALFQLDVQPTAEGVDYRFAAVNRAYERLAGCGSSALLGQSIVARGSILQVDQVASAHARLRDGAAAATWEQQADAAGGRRDLEVTLALVADEAAPGTRLVGTLHDVTALREATRRQRGLAQRLVDVQEAEQRRLSAELHDRIGQNLTALGLNFELITSPAVDVRTRATRAEDTRALLRGTIAAVRDLVTELRPPALVDYGLLAGLRGLAADTSARTGLAIDVQGAEPVPRLAPATETALYRIAQEGLTNIVKHAQAQRVSVAVNSGKGGLDVMIIDDGRGFAPDAQRSRTGHWGLAVMQDRAAAVGASVRIDTAPGRGTSLHVHLEAPA